MSTEFTREDRYIVFKLSDVERYLTDADRAHLAMMKNEIDAGRDCANKPPFKGLIVEADWPEYEPTWQAIEARVTGAQPAQKAVAYLDLGVGGYTDIGTDLNDEQLASLPKGRHMLGIVGTYGVSGYVSEQDESVRKAWARLRNELHRSPDAPFPGMSEAFERHFSQSFTDRDWRAESGTWAAAWKAAKRHGAQPAPSVPDGWIEAAVAWEVCASIHREYARGKDPFFSTRQGDFAKHAQDARNMLAAAPEAKP